MSRGEWFGPQTARELMASWDAADGTIYQYAREASSVLRALMSDSADELRSQVLASVAAIRKLALERGDLKSALGALDLQTRVHGLITTKHEVRDMGAPPSPEAAEAELRSMLAAHTERAK